MSSTNVGEVIRKLRLERGMTQRDLRWKCGLSEATVSKIETGDHSLIPGSALKLAKALGVPVSRFFKTDAEWQKWKRKV